MFRTGLLVSAAIALAGCASTIQSITDRAIMSDHLEENEYGSKIKSMSGDRRLIRVVKNTYEVDPQGPQLGPAADLSRYVSREHLICAETHADAISIRTSKGAISGGANSPVASVSDEIGGSLEKVFDRTSDADLFRQAAWQLCNSYANGVLSRAEYATSLKGLVTGVAARLTKKEEEQSQRSETPNEEACKKKPKPQGCPAVAANPVAEAANRDRK